MSKDRHSIADELESISSGSYWFLIGWILEYATGFLTQILLTNSLSTSSYGVYAFIRKVTALVVGLTTGGATTALNRFLSKHTSEPSKQDGVLGLSFGLSVGLSFLFGTALYVSAPKLSTITFTGELPTSVIWIVAITFPLITAIKTLGSAFRALEKIQLKIILDSIVRPTFLLVVVGGIVLFSPTLEHVVAGLVVASLATLGVGTILAKVYIERTPSLHISWSVVTDYFEYSLPMMLSQSSSLLFRRIDIFMLSYFSVSTAVGVYNIALLVSGTLLLPLAGFSQLFPPIASRMYEKSDMDRLEGLYGTITRWSLMLTTAGFAGIFVYREELLAVFGPDYSTGVSILIILAIGQLVNSAAGPADHLLAMSDHQYILFANQAGMSIFNVGLNYLLLTKYGPIGTAVATTIVFASLNIARVVEIYLLEGIFPYNWSFLKFLPALGVATFTMYLVRSSLMTPLSYLGIPLGLSIYVASLFIFGMEQVDKDIVGILFLSEDTQ